MARSARTLVLVRILRRGMAAAVVAAAIVVPPAVQASASAPGRPAAASPVPGWAVPGYTWTRTLATDGVSVYAGTLSDPSAAPSWTVTIFAPAVSSLTGQPTTTELGTAAWAEQTAKDLQAAGYAPRVDALPWPAYTDTPHGIQGYRVRTGSYPTQAAAVTAAAALSQAGFTTATAQWTGYDADQPPDAEQVHVAVIDPSRLHGTVEATHGSAIAERTTTSQLAQQAGALVAVNGGFFVTADADGFQGVPSGLAAYHGMLQAMSVGDRAALILSASGQATIGHLVSQVTLHAGPASHPVDGLNRKPGLVRDCGWPGLQPTSEPRQDFTCTSTDDTVLFTAQFGAALPAGPGTQALLDRDGRVVSVGAPGGTVPPGGSAIQAIGASATWLAHLTVGTRVSIQAGQRDDRTGQLVPLSPVTSIVSAAPVLLHDGHLAIDAATEGVIDPGDRSFNFAWGEIRQPRTMAGIDAHHRLLLVTVDGREPGVSEGLTLSEEAVLMRELGTREAMNLDGGGSTAMAVNGVLVNHPSDPTGERADGDAVVVVPGQQR
jgi:exopolysaccharide biosynthesis protein